MYRAIVALSISLLISGCYRTEYANMRPQQAPMSSPVQESAVNPLSSAGGWQSFFLWGLVPGTITIPATQACGAPENIGVIKTRRSFLEGLVASVAGFYVNIYSPWDGAVYCRKDRA